jgi:hypothetical protein
VNHLFIRLYLDEDVSVVIKQLLASRGYDVLTTQEATKLGVDQRGRSADQRGRSSFHKNSYVPFDPHDQIIQGQLDPLINALLELDKQQRLEAL